MQQLSDLWARFDARRRAMLAGGLSALLVVLVILARLAATPGMALLYSGLETASAGEVVAALEARGVAHEVRGDAIYVDQSERDALRMALATEGLPANGAAGYELLDGLQGFGTTAQMFDAAYWRAKEGELARTVQSSPMVRTARVHIANASSEPFATRSEITASVTLRPVGGGIPETFARALRYMVASAVPGLLPANVTVIDADSGNVIGSDTADVPGADGQQRADALRANIERLLTARVGPGNAMVEVNVDLVSERETLLERRIDPDSRVIIATDSEERSNAATNAGNAAVTVASNLPEAEAQGAAAQTSEQQAETRERVSYDVSEIQREVEAGPGRVRRISVAVLVNGVPGVDAQGAASIQPRSVEELEVLGALVRSAIGFDAERGDQVTIRSMAFDIPAATTGEPAAIRNPLSALDGAQLARGVLLAIVGLALVFGVIRPAIAAAGENRVAARNLAPAATQPAGAEAAGIGRNLRLPSTDGSDGQPAGWGGDLIRTGEDTGSAMQARPLEPVDRLRQLIREREAETVEILRSWMEEDEEPTR